MADTARYAIPTEFKGVTYRSRLEVKWAAFFMESGLAPTYEPKRFCLARGKNGCKYTPDFYLNGTGVYVEVKPILRNKREDSEQVELPDSLRRRLLAGSEGRCWDLALQTRFLSPAPPSPSGVGG